MENNKLEKSNGETVTRPVIKKTDELNKIANKLKTSPTSIANYCVDAFIEVCNQYIPEMEKDLKKRYIDDVFKIKK